MNSFCFKFAQILVVFHIIFVQSVDSGNFLSSMKKPPSVAWHTINSGDRDKENVCPVCQEAIRKRTTKLHCGVSLIYIMSLIYRIKLEIE